MTAAAAVVLALSVVVLGGGPARAAGSSAISGEAFQDLNRSATRDSGEPAYANHQLYLFTGAGAYVTTTVTDANGAYRFSGLGDGAYRVEYASPSWSGLRNDWVPTTTGSIYPVVSVQLAGAATADFGWRPIVRSTTAGSPVATYTGPSGLRVESYNDAVLPQSVHDSLLAGQLVGQEASTVTIRLDLGPTSACGTSVSSVDGRYSGYAATVTIAWAAWLDTPGQTLFHEYGHAWSLYYAYLAQQDGNLTSYLQARQLAGDPRVDSEYRWDRRELIAEDYRQLFGTPAAQAAAHMNTDIPAATAVPGLRDFLVGPFRQAATTPPPPPPPPPPAPAPTVGGLAVSPSPVVKAGTVAFTVSSPAAVTVEVLDAKGVLVRTLLANASRPAGDVSTVWDRKDAAGRRAKSGTYTVSVRAVADGGATGTATRGFSVA